MSEVETPPEQGVAPRSAGAQLMQARERQGLTLALAASELHLDAQVVGRLERDDFRDLGAPVYVRGHLRRYAQLLGEDPTLIEALYRATTGEQRVPDLARIVTQPYTSAPRTRRLGTWPMVLIGAAILLGGLVWWAMQQQPAVSIVKPAPTSQVTQPATDSAGGVAATVGGTAAEGGADSVAAPTAGAPPVAPPADALAGEGNAPAAAAGDTGLLLRFNSGSWVEVYTQNGERKVYDLVDAGGIRRIGGPGPWRVVLGNPAGVAASVDGRPVSIPVGTREDPIVRVWLERDGRVRASR
ncbi:MAG: DUF4115 domain-containing protein [Steroidobacteraceae bacterium]